MIERRSVGAERALVIAALAGAAPSLDTSVNIALPAISTAFGLRVGAVSWVVVGYVLTYAALLLGCGRLADRLGHRRVLVVGLAVSTVAFALCALAPTFPLLVAARVAQGAGAGLILASAPALVTLSVPPASQPRALGRFQGCVWLAFAIGPPVGGVVLGRWGWPAVWSYRVPVGLGLLGLVLLTAARRGSPVGRSPVGAQPVVEVPSQPGRAVPPPPPDSAAEPAIAAEPQPPGRGRPESPPVPLDLAGASALALALVGLLLAISRGGELGWSSPVVVGAAAMGAVAAAAFVVVERRAVAPVVDLALFRRPGFALANVLNLAANASGFVILLLVPYYLVDVRGLGPVAGGLALAASPLATALCALLAGRLVGRVGVGPLSALGLGFETAGLVAVSRLGADTAMVAVVAALALTGIGLGLFQVPNQSFVMGTIPRTAQGVAGGMTQAVRTVGVLVGVAGAGTLLEARQATHAARLAVDLDDPAGFLPAFGEVFVAAALVAAAATAVALLRSRARPASAA